jgi:Putative peptidoglycan binding domain
MNEHISFGAHESPESIQDIHAHQMLDMANMPAEEFEVEYSFPNYNQRAIGICTGIDLCHMAEKIWGIPFSSRFTYLGGKRTYDGNLTEGSSNLTMLRFGNNFGFLPLSLDPTGNDCRGSYDEWIAKAPTYTAEQFAEAKKYRITGYAKAPLDPIGFATSLARSKYGLITRMAVGDNFYRPSWSKDDLELLKAPTTVTGGHSIKVTGYKGLDANQIRLMRNTWGDKRNPTTDDGRVWCDDGNIKYKFITQEPYVTEAYIVFAEPVMFKHTFNTDILFGQTSAEVVALQRTLVQLGLLIMPKGVAMGYYGDLTAKAVLEFQRKYKVAPPEVIESLAGKRVGQLTRNKLNE